MRCYGPGCGGSPHDIEYRHFAWFGGVRACDRGCLAAASIPDNQREYEIQHGLVDIVAHTMTITCGQLKREDSSSVYFDAHQRVLMLKNSKTPSLADLRGQKVCSTSGASSIAKIIAAKAVLVPMACWADCLVLLQQGDATAISIDDCILKGLDSQDPWTELKGPPLTNEPYGPAVNKQQPNFVAFVSPVLEQLRTYGKWCAWYAHWIATPVPASPTAEYGS